MHEAPAQQSGSASRGITRSVVALGVVSPLTDVSTVMILPVVPLFLVGAGFSERVGRRGMLIAPLLSTLLPLPRLERAVRLEPA